MTTRYDWGTASRSGIYTTAIQMVQEADLQVLRPAFGVQIVADPNNSASVYLGKSDVTAGTGQSTTGYPLAAGDSILIPTRRPEEIYVAAGSGATDLAVNYIII